GFIGRAIAHQIVRRVPGMALVAVANRTPERAVEVLEHAGASDVATVTRLDEFEDAVRAGRPVVTDDALLLADSEQVDVLLEVTGSLEHAAHVVLRAIDAGTHVVLMNAELDGTVGAVLAERAARAGVVLTAC